MSHRADWNFRPEMGLPEQAKRSSVSHLALTGVAIEKLTLRKSSENRSRQDAPQMIRSGYLDIFIPQYVLVF